MLIGRHIVTIPIIINCIRTCSSSLDCNNSARTETALYSVGYRNAHVHRPDTIKCKPNHERFRAYFSSLNPACIEPERPQYAFNLSPGLVYFHVLVKWQNNFPSPVSQHMAHRNRYHLTAPHRSTLSLYHTHSHP